MTHLIALLAAAAITLSPAVPKDNIDVQMGEDLSGKVTLTHCVSSEDYSPETEIPQEYTVINAEDGYVILVREYSFESPDKLNKVLAELSYSDLAPEQNNSDSIFKKQTVSHSSGIFYSLDSFSVSFASPPEGMDTPEITVRTPSEITEVHGGTYEGNRAVTDNASTEFSVICENTAYGTISIIALALIGCAAAFVFYISVKRKNAA